MIRVAAQVNPDSKMLLPEYFLKDLFVYSCGYQHFKTKDYHINRPKGRKDYQLLYIYKGYGTFLIDGETTVFGPGSIILCRPDDPQVYSYYAKDNPEIYWIHFLGTGSSSLLEKYCIRTAFAGESRVLKHIFDEIILELQLRRPGFQEICVADFQKLLIHINRLYAKPKEATSENPHIDKLLAHLNKRYMEPWTVQGMADYCHMSIDYFSHQFKLVVGTPPLQFLNQLRIDHAKEMLLTEDLSIGEISKLVGYNNPLYFSRAFKKATGSSPKLYTSNRV
jgi:AraC-like DNA-binding protein